MKSGARPTRVDRRDFDFFKTKRKFGAALPTFPTEYNVDSGLWMPNQNEACNLFVPPTPPMPYGCTNYTQCDLCADEDGRLYDPSILEEITHANALGGIDIRSSMKAVVKAIPGHPAYFNVQPSGRIDAFDAVRLAMLSTANEKRGVSIGSPYWLRFGAVGSNGIYSMPDFDLSFASWHNWAVKGFRTEKTAVWGESSVCEFLKCKMWQGEDYGDKGFTWINRPIFNATMAVRGSVMFTIDKLLPGETIQTIGIAPYVKDIVAYIRMLFSV